MNTNQSLLNDLLRMDNSFLDEKILSLLKNCLKDSDFRFVKTSISFEEFTDQENLSLKFRSANFYTDPKLDKEKKFNSNEEVNVMIISCMPEVIDIFYKESIIAIRLRKVNVVN